MARRHHPAPRRRVSVTAPRTGTSTVTYNAAGQISAESDAEGYTTAYGYDSAGRLAWKRNALNKYARYAYNAHGQQTRVWGGTEYPKKRHRDRPRSRCPFCVSAPCVLSRFADLFMFCLRYRG